MRHTQWAGPREPQGEAKLSRAQRLQNWHTLQPQHPRTEPLAPSRLSAPAGTGMQAFRQVANTQLWLGLQEEPPSGVGHPMPGPLRLWASGFCNIEKRPGQSCGERAPPLAKVMRKEAWHTQRRDQASGVSLEILEQSTPKTRVCLLSALCFHLQL